MRTTNSSPNPDTSPDPNSGGDSCILPTPTRLSGLGTVLQIGGSDGTWSEPIPIASPMIAKLEASADQAQETLEQMLRALGTIAFDIKWEPTAGPNPSTSTRKTIEHDPGERYDPTDPKDDPTNLTIEKLMAVYRQIEAITPIPEQAEDLQTMQAALSDLWNRAARALAEATQKAGQASEEASSAIESFGEAYRKETPEWAPRRSKTRAQVQNRHQKQRAKAKAGRRARLHADGRTH